MLELRSEEAGSRIGHLGVFARVVGAEHHHDCRVDVVAPVLCRLYMCAFKDVCSNKIVGYAIDKRMKAGLAVRALTNALMQRGYPENVIIHSDRGSQFRSRKFQKALKRYKLRGSMGRVGACGDNAAMESFFSLLQKNVLDRKRWHTRDELRLAIVHWIEAKYHRKRKQRRLGKLTPVEFETIVRSAVELAA